MKTATLSDQPYYSKFLAREVFRTEVFGPVLGMMHVDSLEEALNLVNSTEYGNMACLFTTSGSAARKFRYEAHAGNIGINIGVAAPMAYFPFQWLKASFFGDLHGQEWMQLNFSHRKRSSSKDGREKWTRKF